MPVKPSTAISSLLLLNLALIAAVGYLVKSRPDSAPAGGPRPGDSPASAIATQVIIKGAAPRILTVTNDFRWAQLETEDYREYIARLRAIGCPEQTIRDIIIADLDKLFAPRVQTIFGRRPDLQYWHSEEEELANNQDPREWLQQERDVDREKRAILLDLLGVDVVRERMKLKGHQDYYERRLSFLPEDKQTAVRLLLERYDELEGPLRAKLQEADASLTAEEAERLAVLRGERELELARLLTPEEQQQFELWLSPSANAVRYAFYGLEPTEAEFLKVYGLQQAFDAAWSPDLVNLDDPAQLTQWAQAKQELDRQLQEALGPERYREFQRGQDADWHRLNATAARYDLPREKAGEAYAMKQTFAQMRAFVEGDPGLTPEQKQLAVEAMKRETRQAVTGVLGDQGTQYFLADGHGQWLR